MERRGFLAAMLAAAAAPAFVRAGVSSGILMPVHVARPRFRYDFPRNRLGFVTGIAISNAQTGGQLATLDFDSGGRCLYPEDVFNVRLRLLGGAVCGAGSWNVGPGGRMEMQRDPLAHVHAVDLIDWPRVKTPSR